MEALDYCLCISLFHSDDYIWAGYKTLVIGGLNYDKLGMIACLVHIWSESYNNTLDKVDSLNVYVNSLLIILVALAKVLSIDPSINYWL